MKKEKDIVITVQISTDRRMSKETMAYAVERGLWDAGLEKDEYSVEALTMNQENRRFERAVAGAVRETLKAKRAKAGMR